MGLSGADMSLRTALVLFFAIAAHSSATPDSPGAILARIHPPRFAPGDFVVPSNTSSDCAAINAAIDSAHSAGGGRVLLLAGVWISNGPINLKSDVNLHLSTGATLRFGTTASDYLPAVLTKFEGTLLYNYSPLIRGYELTNVALTGERGSVIDGQGQAGFSQWRHNQTADQNALREMGNDTTAHYMRVFGAGHFLRPVFVQFFGCKNVLVEGVTLVDAPFWVIHPVFSTNVIIRGVTVDSPYINNDGIDPDSSVDVLIENNNITSGDDCIAIKSGRDADAWQVGQPSQNVIVRNNICNGPGNGVCVGSEMSGGVSNVIVTNNSIHNCETALYFKSNLDRGAWVRDIVVDGMIVEDGTRGCINFDNNYHYNYHGQFPTLFQNYSIRNFRCNRIKGTAISVDGLSQMPIRDVTIDHFVAEQVEKATSFKNTKGFML